jgi:hypothetical protein
VDSSPEFQDFLDNLKPMTPEEQLEALLQIASAITAGTDPALLPVLRTYVLRMLPDDVRRSEVVEVIERQIALRNMAKG